MTAIVLYARTTQRLPDPPTEAETMFSSVDAIEQVVASTGVYVDGIRVAVSLLGSAYSGTGGNTIDTLVTQLQLAVDAAMAGLQR